ncbi:hypothetical protein GGU11DRAFT_750241 [Lentinula aff. detonsa]|nr:hypothetical protein GGU11DRAFT_750241 [Lentinula aff. detonsa]
MERIEAEEKAAREAEEERKAEEQRVAEEKRKAEEKRIAKERRMEEEKQREEERKKRLEERQIAEEKQRVEEAAAEEEDERVRSAAYAKLVEENRVEREKAAKELERQQKKPITKAQPVTVIIPPRTLGSKKKIFKSKSVISDDSDIKEKEGGSHSDPDGDFELEQDDAQPPLPSTDTSQSRPACSRLHDDKRKPA